MGSSAAGRRVSFAPVASCALALSMGLLQAGAPVRADPPATSSPDLNAVPSPSTGPVIAAPRQTVPRAAPPVYTLPPVTVSSDWLGAPDAQTVHSYAGARDIVTERAVHESGARTIEDALRQVPGVRAEDESGTGILPNIGVRGLNPRRSEQALILVDGVPAALAPYGQTGLSLFPLTLQNVARIDVVRGGAAVHYGPNNVGGVINFITHPIAETFGVTAKEVVTLAENGHVLTDSYVRLGGFTAEDFGWQVQANVIDGESFREHSATQVHNLVVDGEWLPTEDAAIKARLQYYDTDNELPGALTPQRYDADRNQSTRPHDFFRGDTVRGHVTYHHAAGDDSELQWSVFGHRSTRIFGFGVPLDAEAVDLVATSPREFTVYGTEPRYSFTLDGPIPQKLLVGMRYLREEVDFVVDRRDLNTGAISVPRDWRFENDAYAVYLSDTLHLLGGDLKLTPGVRYEYLRSNFRNNADGATQDNTTRDVLPGLDLGYQLDEQVFLFANYHQSLRPVQFVHIVRGGDLVSERADNYEAGVRYDMGGGLGWTATLFRLDFEDKIEFDRTAGRFRNLGKALHQGLEAGVRWSPAAWPGLQLQAAYTYLDTEQRAGAEQGKRLPFASRHQVSAAADYHAGSLGWNLNAAYYSAAFTDAANTVAESANGSIGEIPAYWLLNGQVSKDWRWRGAVVRTSLGINNILDEDYYFRGVDYSFGRMPGPDRAFLFSINVDL